MTLRHCWLAIARRLAFCGLVGALLLAIPAFAGTAWAEAAEASPVDSIKTSLDEIEATIAREDVTAETLAGLRQSLNTAIETIRTKTDELEPRVRELDERLK
jgi:septal ring factor EnvC (AmiA/AmiB activator)